MLGPLLRLFRRDVDELTYPVHDLSMNHGLSPKDYEACVSLSNSMQALYDDAPGYIARKGLDPEIFLPGNEWAGIVPRAGLPDTTSRC